MKNYFKEYPTEQIKPNLILKELESLKSNSALLSLTDKVLEVTLENEYVISNIDNEKIKFSLTVTDEEAKVIKDLISERKQLITGNILYTKNLSEFSIENLQIYKISNPMEKWMEIVTPLSLNQRINVILSILGINPESLLIHERLIFIMRLVPLIQKKYLLLDFSSRELGKSTSYSTLNYPLNTISMTRASIFYNAQSKKTGDFFSAYNCFIMDEFQNIADNEVFKVLQTYKDGDENIGKIVLSSSDIRTSSKSVAILGNPRRDVSYKNIFSKKINIFDGTALHRKNQEDGDAFLSRVDSMLNSWGCRKFSPIMKAENNNNFYLQALFNEVISFLREVDIDMKKIFNSLFLCNFHESSRTEMAVRKTLSGLLKLIFPEIISNENIVINYFKEFNFLYELAYEMRKVVNNTLEILKPSENSNTSMYSLNSERFSLLLEGVRYSKIYACTPHRIIIDTGNRILKIPFDTIGIEQNRTESKILTKFNFNSWYFDEVTNYLTSTYNISASSFAQYSNCYFSQNNNLILYQVKEYLPIGIPIFFKNEEWNEPINYNYLTGEIEIVNNYMMAREYSFYDIRIN